MNNGILSFLLSPVFGAQVPLLSGVLTEKNENLTDSVHLAGLLIIDHSMLLMLIAGTKPSQLFC